MLCVLLLADLAAALPRALVAVLPELGLEPECECAAKLGVFGRESGGSGCVGGRGSGSCCCRGGVAGHSGVERAEGVRCRGGVCGNRCSSASSAIDTVDLFSNAVSGSGGWLEGRRARRGMGICTGNGRRQLMCLVEVECGGVPSSSPDDAEPEPDPPKEDRRRPLREPVVAATRRFNDVFALRRRRGPGGGGRIEMDLRFRGGGLFGASFTVTSR